MSEKKKKVLIVGAGVAGLSCASMLSAQGVDVTILEAKQDIGGRILSHPDPQTPFDMGASWVHGIHQNPVGDILKKEGARLTPTYFDDRIVYDSQGKVITLDPSPLFYTYIEKLKRTESSDLSIQDALSRFIIQHKLSKDQADSLAHRLRVDFETEYGTDLSSLSVFQYDEDKGFSGGDFWVQPSYRILIDTLAKDLKIIPNSPVARIEQGLNYTRVITQDNNIYESDVVVVTASLGVLKSNKIIFSPELSLEKKSAIQKLGMGNLHKSFFIFDQLFWDNHTAINQTFSPLWAELINVSSLYERPVLLALHAGHQAEVVQAMSDSEKAQSLYAVLKKIYPKASAPLHVVSSNWQNDPFTHGSYSYVPVGESYQLHQTLGQPEGRIFFAGEHTNPHYPATVHGAYLSGRRAAQEILREPPFMQGALKS
ncbi:MAG: FAD-dependent oxidoreductase [Alphaproteobacteria bacterium]|nr:FAD-dependent oxidoreductase [Alphaproteobacteria bacterium]